MRKTMFVISTIADPGTDRRQHADAVLANIIRPAAERSGDMIDIIRGERDLSNRRVSQRIVDAILDRDLIVAVAFENNGNVFYEMGIAHAAGRTLLILKHTCFTMPFDLGDYGHIHYTNEDLADAAHAGRPDGPVEALAARLAAQGKAPHHDAPFDRKSLGAFGAPAILDRFIQFSYAEWSKMLLNARTEIWLAGISLSELINPTNERFFVPQGHDGDLPAGPNGNITNLLAIAIAAGVDINIMMMHPDNPALPAMLIKPVDFVGPRDRVLSNVQREIRWSLELWNEARRDSLNPKVRRSIGAIGPIGRWRIFQIRNGMVPQRLTLTDFAMIGTPYFHSIRYASGPAIRARGGDAWHKHFRDELLLLAALNPADEE